MPAKDPVKNFEFVKKSQQKKWETIGIEAFNETHSFAQSKHGNYLEESNEKEEYKRKRAQLIKEYRAKKKTRQNKALKKENALKALTNAIRFRKERQN